MYVKTKDGNRFVNITPNNFDSLSIDMKGNVICIISGRVTNLGIYSHLDEGIKKNFIDAFFAIIHRDIRTESIFHMPATNEAMVTKILEWAKDLDTRPDGRSAPIMEIEETELPNTEPVNNSNDSEAESESEPDSKAEDIAKAEEIIEESIAEREENESDGEQEKESG